MPLSSDVSRGASPLLSQNTGSFIVLRGIDTSRSMCHYNQPQELITVSSSKSEDGTLFRSPFKHLVCCHMFRDYDSTLHQSDVKQGSLVVVALLQHVVYSVRKFTTC